jgi:hypothetical protein
MITTTGSSASGLVDWLTSCVGDEIFLFLPADLELGLVLAFFGASELLLGVSSAVIWQKSQ